MVEEIIVLTGTEAVGAGKVEAGASALFETEGGDGAPAVPQSFFFFVAGPSSSC